MEREIKRHRIQLSEAEIQTLIHHGEMELDSLNEVFEDLKDRTEEKEYVMDIIRQHETLTKILNKLHSKIK